MRGRVHTDCDVEAALRARRVDAGFERDRGAFGFTRRPGSEGNRRGGGWRGFGGAPEMLDLFSGGTFTRSTEGSYLTGAATDGSSAFLAWAGVNERRQEYDPNLPGGLGIRLEGSITNVIAHSEDFADAGWAKTGATVGAGAALDPDGGADNDTITFNAVAGDQVAHTFASADNVIVSMSVWLRTTAGTKDLRLVLLKKDGTESSTAITVTTTWQRFTAMLLSVGAGAGTPAMIIRNNAGATAGAVLAWGAQTEPSRFVSSYIRTAAAAVTRGADTFDYAVGSYPSAFVTVGMRIQWAPDWLPSDMHSLGQGFTALGVNGTLELLISYNAAGDPARVFVDGAAKNSGAFSWTARGQLLTTAVKNAGAIVISGATAGNGTTTVASFTTPSGTLNVGRASSQPFSGRMGRYIEIPT